MSGRPLTDMGDTITSSQVNIWKMKYVEELCSGLKYQLTHQQYTDVTVKVDGKTFECHRVILSSVSPYFDAMFNSGMRECQDSTVTLVDMESHIFEKILKYIYSGEEVVDTSDVDGLLQASAMLQIRPLVERCEHFMLGKVDQENCIATWRFAEAHGCYRLAQEAFKRILKDFSYIWRCQDFSALDKKELLDIIRDNDLNTPNEETVCDAVFRWICSDQVTRDAYVGEIMESLRLPLVQPEYLLEVLERKPFIKDNEQCRNVIEEAKRYHLLPARSQEFVSPRMIYRNFGDFEEVVVCVGGSNELQSTTSQVTCYSFMTKKWYDLAFLPYNPGVEFATCSYGNAIFLSGGSTRMHGMVFYNNTYNKWDVCQSMLLGRRRHMMIAVGNCVYVVGGYDDSAEPDFNTLLTIESFQLSTGTWEDAGYLAVPVRSAAAAVMGEHVYIFGGVTNTDCDTKVIQCFDTRQRTCTVIGELPSFCRLSVAISYQHKMFIVSPGGIVLEFDEDKTIKLRGSIPGFDRCNFGLILRNGCIVVLGGTRSDTLDFDEVVEFDLSTNTSSVSSHYLPERMFGFGCVKSVINKKCMFSYSLTG